MNNLNEYQILSRNADGNLVINHVWAENSDGLKLPTDSKGRVIQGQELLDRLTWASDPLLAPYSVPKPADIDRMTMTVEEFNSMKEVELTVAIHRALLDISGGTI